MKASSVMVVSLMLGCNSSKQEIDESRCAYAMTLCTIAGTGTSGYNDINIRATETQLRDPPLSSRMPMVDCWSATQAITKFVASKTIRS